jgi:hypothetical protein
MPRFLLMIGLSLVCVSVGCDGGREETKLPASEVRTLIGTLRNDSSSPLGMITGWVVDEASSGDTIPVDLSDVITTAQQLTGKRVQAKGTMMDRMDASGTSKPVFVVQSIQAVDQ